MLKNNEIFDDEIDLLDYIRIIIKHRATVLFFFTLAVLVVNYLVYLSPQFYVANSMIHVGSIEEPLMTAQDAGHLLEENSSYVVSSLKPQASASATDLLSMYNSGKILFKAGLESDFICISVKDKNSSRAVDICNAIASMLVDEGNKIYHREKNIVNMRIKSYEKEEGFIDQQLSLLKSSVSKRDLDSYVSQLQEMKDYYESKYGPLTNKIINSKAIFNRSEPFSRVEEAGNAVNYARLNLDQVFTILGSGLFLGIVFAFFQEFYINNFK